MNNLWIKETHVNNTENYIFSDMDFYETFTDNRFTLFKSLRKEFGSPTKMYIDTKEGPKQIGWTFSKKSKYIDTDEPYIHVVWVEVSTENPYQAIKPVHKCFPK